MYNAEKHDPWLLNHSTPVYTKSDASLARTPTHKVINGSSDAVACVGHQDDGVPLWTLSLFYLSSYSCFHALLWFEVMSFTSLISFHPALSLWRPFVCILVWDVNLLLVPRFLVPLIRPRSVLDLMRLTSTSFYASLSPLLLPVHPSGAWSLLIPTNHCSQLLAHKAVFVQFSIQPPPWCKILCKWWCYKNEGCYCMAPFQNIVSYLWRTYSGAA